MLCYGLGTIPLFEQNAPTSSIPSLLHFNANANPACAVTELQITHYNIICTQSVPARSEDENDKTVLYDGISQ